MTLPQSYMLLALAIILLIANCLGAAFTIKRNGLGANRVPSGSGASRLSLGWSKTYGRLAIAQGILVVVAVAATAITSPQLLTAFIALLKLQF